jgi:phospholipid/cholesterol/gamma-HCH transport system substrate-binding protein
MSRLSLTHRFALLGVALLLAVGAGVGLILEGFTGHFSSYDVVYADIPASGTGISPGSVVIFRDITVGAVAGLGRQLPDGLLRVQLHIDPDDLPTIPSKVQADVEIATVFGTQGINLVPPPALSAAHLVVGQTIPSVSRSETTTLQGDATDLDNLLNALHPVALDETLTAIATALRDQGPSLGATIDDVATYLNEMVPQLPAIENDLRLLGPVTDNLSAATPSILGTLANGSVTAQTISQEATQFDALLAGASPTAGNLTSLLEATETSFENLVADAAPLLGDVAANPSFIAQTLSGFDAWSKAFAAAETQGPYLSFSGDLEISGSVQLVAAALGLPGSDVLVEQGLGPQNFNPPTYTAADCPTYGSERGPNCSAQTAGSDASDVPAQHASDVTTASEEQAATAIAAGLDHGKPPPSPAVAALLLEPLLLQLSGAR